MTKQDTPERRGQHTPGPWGIQGKNIRHYWGGSKEFSHTSICEVSGQGIASLENANARLIAAAPDLLCWLEAIISQGEAQRKAGDNVITISGGMAHGIMESIRKAKGE
jgi:hypothetical protein